MSDNEENEGTACDVGGEDLEEPERPMTWTSGWDDESNDVEADPDPHGKLRKPCSVGDDMPSWLCLEPHNHQFLLPTTTGISHINKQHLSVRYCGHVRMARRVL